MRKALDHVSHAPLGEVQALTQSIVQPHIFDSTHLLAFLTFLTCTFNTRSASEGLTPAVFAAQVRVSTPFDRLPLSL